MRANLNSVRVCDSHRLRYLSTWWFCQRLNVVLVKYFQENITAISIQPHGLLAYLVCYANSLAYWPCQADSLSPCDYVSHSLLTGMNDP